MASLLDLPLELLEAVVVHLSHPDLSRISLTSSAYYEVFSPRLYHCIDWTWLDDRVRPPFDLLLRTVLSNTRLASHVQSISLRGGGIVPHSEWRSAWDIQLGNGEGNEWRPIRSVRSIWTSEHTSVFTISETEQLQAHMSTLHRPSPSTWISEFKRGSVDAVVAILISRLSDLESLDLGFGYLHRSIFIPAVLRHFMMERASACSYPKLKSVTLAHDVLSSTAGFWSDVDLFRPLFFLPQVETVSAVLAEPVVFAWPIRPPVLPSLLRLELHKSSATEYTLGCILSCVPSLKHLTYDHCRIIESGPPDYECSPLLRCRILDSALANVRTTLESLIMKVRFEHWDQIPVTDPWNSDLQGGLSGRLTVLQHMQKLEQLEIPWVLLLGWEPEGWDLKTCVPWSGSLPSCLESLTLRDDMQKFTSYKWTEHISFQAAITLAETRKLCLPALRELSFTYIWYDWALRTHEELWRDRYANEIYDFCVKQGLSCKIKREPWPHAD